MPETKPTLQLEHRMCRKTRKYKAKKVMGRIFLSEKIAANNTSDKGGKQQSVKISGLEILVKLKYCWICF